HLFAPFSISSSTVEAVRILTVIVTVQIYRPPRPFAIDSDLTSFDRSLIDYHLDYSNPYRPTSLYRPFTTLIPSPPDLYDKSPEVIRELLIHQAVSLVSSSSPRQDPASTIIDNVDLINTRYCNLIYSTLDIIPSSYIQNIKNTTKIITPKSSSVVLKTLSLRFNMNVYYDFIIIEGSNKIVNHPSNSLFNHSINTTLKDSVALNPNTNSNKKDNRKAGNNKSKSGLNNNNNSNNNKKDKKQKP
ncbi:hypothetical protein N7530_006444, partial [Penicillium desertorum]